MRFLKSRFGHFGFFLTSLILILLNTLNQTDSMVVKTPDLYGNDKQSAGPNKPTQIKTEPNKALLHSNSPYDIALFITDNPDADLSTIWNQLGIKNANFGYRSISEEQRGERTDRFLSKCNNCDVETYSCELDGEPGKEVLLKVSDLVAESCRYLVFKQVKIRESRPEWKLLGHIDHGFGRYRMPEHSLVYGSGRSWLVVKVQEGSGSGFAVYHGRLVQVDSTGLKEILRFPSEGHLSTCCYYPTREFTCRILKCEINNRVTIVELELSVSYSASSGADKVLLWKKRQKAIYEIDPNSNSLVLDKNKSDLSQEEIDAIYFGEELSDENFIKYNNAELSRIALGVQESRKEWLRLFLNQDEQSPEKDRLRRLIDR